MIQWNDVYNSIMETHIELDDILPRKAVSHPETFFVPVPTENDFVCV